MIERFNFYDIYGNLIPGSVFLLLLLVPFGIIENHWPNLKIEFVTIALLASYLIGHFIQSMASKAFPSKLAQDHNGKPGYPSVMLLNPSNNELAGSLKTRIEKLVMLRFSIDLHIGDEADEANPNIAVDRNSAFFLCRPIANKSTAYAEQFQGLYTMMRGLSITLGLAVFYDFGWAVYPYAACWDKVIFIVACLVMLFFAVKRAFYKPSNSTISDSIALATLAAMLFAGGHVFAAGVPRSEHGFYTLIVVIAFSVLGALCFYSQYRYFAGEFAKAVWTYFAVLDPTDKASQ